MRSSSEREPLASATSSRDDWRCTWFVSRWENHSSEKAKRAFAEEIAKVLVKPPELQPSRHSPGGS
jgi:hypothetical protein